MCLIVGGKYRTFQGGAGAQHVRSPLPQVCPSQRESPRRGSLRPRAQRYSQCCSRGRGIGSAIWSPGERYCRARRGQRSAKEFIIIFSKRSATVALTIPVSCAMSMEEIRSRSTSRPRMNSAREGDELTLAFSPREPSRDGERIFPAPPRPVEMITSFGFKKVSSDAWDGEIRETLRTSSR